jgi:hypothetical protein
MPPGSLTIIGDSVGEEDGDVKGVGEEFGVGDAVGEGDAEGVGEVEADGDGVGVGGMGVIVPTGALLLPCGVGVGVGVGGVDCGVTKDLQAATQGWSYPVNWKVAVIVCPPRPVVLTTLVSLSDAP